MRRLVEEEDIGEGDLAQEVGALAMERGDDGARDLGGSGCVRCAHADEPAADEPAAAAAADGGGAARRAVSVRRRDGPLGGGPRRARIKGQLCCPCRVILNGLHPQYWLRKC